MTAAERWNLGGPSFVAACSSSESVGWPSCGGPATGRRSGPSPCRQGFESATVVLSDNGLWSLGKRRIRCNDVNRENQAMANEMVREAVGVFHDERSLQGAADELMISGFDRSYLSILAGHRTI